MTSFSTYGLQATGSATIYQFPVGGRAGLVASNSDRRQFDAVKQPDGRDYVLTDAWYHQEAISDAEAVTPATKQ